MGLRAPAIGSGKVVAVAICQLRLPVCRPQADGPPPLEAGIMKILHVFTASSIPLEFLVLQTCMRKQLMGRTQLARTDPVPPPRARQGIFLWVLYACSPSSAVHHSNDAYMERVQEPRRHRQSTWSRLQASASKAEAAAASRF
jgi:hypothetical protein